MRRSFQLLETRLEEDTPVQLHGASVDVEAADLAFRSAINNCVRQTKTGMVDDVVCRCANLDSHILPGDMECLAKCRIEQEELRAVLVIPLRVAECGRSRLNERCSIEPVLEILVARNCGSNLIRVLLAVTRQ